MKMVFLGTGGSYPSRERMTQAFAVKYRSDVVLFDVGEGTQRQMMVSPLSFMQVKTICITHFHGDHFLGLGGLIQTMQLNNRQDPLEILVPPGGKAFVDAFVALGHFRLQKFEVAVHELADGAQRAFQGYSITAFQLNHPVPTIGFRFEESTKPGRFDPQKAKALGVPEGRLFSKLQDGEPVQVEGHEVHPEDVMGPPRPGRSFAYLTDTGPCPRLVEAARGVDALIIEATADDSLTDYANQYGHLAASQAAGVARDSKVGDLFLVHTSARYKEPEPILGQARQVFERTQVPSDLTEVDYPWG